MREPFFQGPDVIGRASGHGRRPVGSPRALLVTPSERSEGPAEVVAVRAEVGRGVVEIPVLGEAIALADAGILVTIGPVVSFHEGEVDATAAGELLQSGLQLAPAPVGQSRADADDPSLPAMLVDVHVQQVRRRTPSRLRLATDATLGAAGVGFPIRLEDRLSVGLVFVATDQAPLRAAVEVVHQGTDVRLCPFPRHQRDNRLVLRIEGDVVPVVSPKDIERIVLLAVLLLNL